ncbi:MAG TPA: GNAT family N-acetyltransferase [Armatimonadota bacterium]
MIIERLDPQRHQRESFSCGESTLDQFLHAHARKYYERGLGVTWVATSKDTPTRIDGYYTLSMNALLADELQSSRIRLTRIPVVLLGRLAVAVHAQGNGLGTHLLMHALQTAYHLSQLIGAHAVLVDPLNDRVMRWYSRYRFLPLPGAPQRLFLPMATLRPLITPLTGATVMIELLSLAHDLTTVASPEKIPRT